MSVRRGGFHRSRAMPFRVIPVAWIVLGLAGCGRTSSPAAVPRGTPPGTIHVVLKNIMYMPMTVHARVGQTVTWTNEDDAPHNVTYVAGPRFTSSPTFTNGGFFTLKLTHAGVLRYVCTIHPGMHGTIFVAP